MKSESIKKATDPAPEPQHKEECWKGGACVCKAAPEPQCSWKNCKAKSEYVFNGHRFCKQHCGEYIDKFHADWHGSAAPEPLCFGASLPQGTAQEPLVESLLRMGKELNGGQFYDFITYVILPIVTRHLDSAAPSGEADKCPECGRSHFAEPADLSRKPVCLNPWHDAGDSRTTRPLKYRDWLVRILEENPAYMVTADEDERAEAYHLAAQPAVSAPGEEPAEHICEAGKTCWCGESNVRDESALKLAEGILTDFGRAKPTSELFERYVAVIQKRILEWLAAQAGSEGERHLKEFICASLGIEWDEAGENWQSVQDAK